MLMPFTVTLQDAVFPLEVFAVIVAVPNPFAVTLPLLTDATDVLEDVHVTDLLVALEGDTVADKVFEAPLFSVIEVLLMEMPVGLTVEGVEEPELLTVIVRVLVPERLPVILL